MRRSRSLSQFTLALVLAIPVIPIVILRAEAIAIKPLATENGVAQTVDGRKVEADRLLNLGLGQHQTGQYEAALHSWEQALLIYRSISDRNGEAQALANLGIVSQSLLQYDKATAYYQQALSNFQQVKDRDGEARAVAGLGIAYSSLSEYDKAITYYQQALPILQQVKNRNVEARVLNNIGFAHQSLLQYDKAITYYQQALPLLQQVKDRYGEAKALNNLGISYDSLSEYDKAITYYEQSLSLFQQVKDQKGAAGALIGLGNAYRSLSEYDKAIIYYEQSLSLFQQVKDQKGEAGALIGLGNAYFSLSDYEKAIAYYQQSLPLSKEVKDRNGEANALNGIGAAYRSLSDYEKAIAYYQQSLPLSKEVKDRNGEANALNNIGIVYSALSQYEKAIIYHQQALPLFQKVKDRHGEANALKNLGAAYRSLLQHDKAITYYQQALTIYQQVKDREGEARVLNALGNTYYSLSQHRKAITYYQQALTIYQQIKDRNGEAGTLTNLGNVYSSPSEYEKALAYYQQALPIFQQVKNRDGEGTLLSNLGDLLQQQQQRELAIVLYKQSVNVRETIRVGNRNLPKDSQDSYTQSVAGTYRRLADLLLAQGRLAEAQRVLELLKLQELKDFTRSDPADGKSEITLLQPERQILQKYGTLIAFGQKIYECERSGKPCKDLRDQLDEITVAFNHESNAFTRTLRERLAKDPAFLSSDQLGSTATNIVTAEPGTVLIYPLVLGSKIRLLLAVRAGEQGVVFRRMEIANVGQQKLWKTVSRFRALLQSPTSDPKELKQVSAQLYSWLIAPLEVELNNRQVHHLVFALDRATRYIPMAALFDERSQQYLIQKYAVSTILSAELTDTRDHLPVNKDQISVLALGVSKAVASFNALPNVPQELKVIVRDQANPQGIYSGLAFLDENFDYSALRDNLSHRQILHIATHGKFEPGRPENSFILPGKGKPLTIDEIQKLRNYMGDVHLVVLSACQTAVGGPDESGIEIPGISFYFLKNRVKAVIASLWLVNDSSTSQLMRQFYTNLSTGRMGKAEALRQAQISLIAGKDQSQSTSDRSSVNFSSGQGLSNESISHNLDHPYYWAPFILIGNGL
ncbi:MAG: tetratricopeptide repeat protein [Leptolyngbya sp. BL-A-14]